MKKIIKSTVAMFFATVALTSCLKDDTMVLDPEKAGGNIIEFVNPTDIAVHGSTTALYVMAFPIVTGNTDIPVSINYAGAEDGAPQDITVNFGLGDLATITQYNTEQSKSLTLMDPATYTINATSVVIPKGKKTATFTISVKTSTFDLTKSYALPLKIKSVTAGTISTNFSNIILNIAAKNKYDGSYSYTATITAADRPTLFVNQEFNYSPYEVQLRTSGANSNNMWNSAYGDYLLPALTAAKGITGLGTTNLLLNFDPATNKVILADNAVLNPANGRDMYLDPAAPATTNRFDPVTHDVYLQFYLSQPGFAPSLIKAYLKYKGPRP